MFWRPNLRGQVTETVARLLDTLQAKIEELQQKVDRLQQAKSVPLNAATIRLELQAGGRSPLNVEGLLGRLAQPQTGGAPMLSANPAISDPITQDGALFVLSGAPNTLYRINRSQDPATFDPIGGSGSVTSVGISGGTTGLGVSGSPITGAGTITLTLASQLNINSTQVLQQRITGWTTPTGTSTRSGYNTTTATATQVAEALKALIEDLKTHGLIGS